MPGHTAANLKPGRDVLGLVVFLVLCLGVSGVGAVITATSVATWYQGLQKPLFNPPDWVFAPVWTTLYIVMAVAAWRVWRRTYSAAGQRALTLFVVQLGLNLLWSFLFFGYQQVGLALIEIVILLIAIIGTTTLFWQIDRLAGALFVPYALWVGYATVLNASLWLLN